MRNIPLKYFTSLPADVSKIHSAVYTHSASLFRRLALQVLTAARGRRLNYFRHCSAGGREEQVHEIRMPVFLLEASQL